MTERRMHLNVFVLTTGHHETSWRHPSNGSRASVDIDHYVKIAQLAEEGLFDAVFFGDGLDLGPHVSRGMPHALEPITLLSALAMRTEHVGLVSTVSTSFNDPFATARRLASLDHISKGRAGWNVVTSREDSEARNFGHDTLFSHAERYERAEEFVQVANALWASWADGSHVEDRESGEFADTSKIVAVNHRGKHFKVAGPLNVPPTPQGRPVLFQAGQTGPGRDFAARHAEAIFTAQHEMGNARAFYSDMRSRISAAGRNPDDVKILPGFSPVIASTEAEARAMMEELLEIGSLEFSLDHMSQMLQVDLSQHDLDGPVPALPPAEQITGLRSRFELLADVVERQSPTIRQLLAFYSVSRGHHTVVGTPEMVADALEEWFLSRAADGFNIMPGVLPGWLEPFVEHVVPLLQKRDLFRHEYGGLTLRDNLGDR